MAILRVEGKTYIEGVRRMSWDTGEMCEFASALVAALEAMGQPVPYHYVMGTSGAAFRFTLNPGQWDFSVYGIRNIAEDPYEPVRRAFQAVGREITLFERGSLEEDSARMTASIDRGAPVLVFGVVGPSDCCVITGYDQGGQVLLGWSTFQDIPDDHNIPHDPTGYFRKPGWHDNLGGYILIGERTQPPPQRAIYLDALRWAVHLVRAPRMRNQYATGLEGLRLWAEEMTQAQYFPEGEDTVLGGRYLSAAINMTMLRDHLSAVPFLEQVSRDEPDLAPGLAPAIACYAQVDRLRLEMDAIMSDNFSPAAIKAIGDPAARRAYAGTLLQIRDQEELAITYIERTLATPS